MKTALSGTPGVGKTAVSKILEERGYKVLDLNQMACENDFVCGHDEIRDSKEIDLEGLDEFIEERFGDEEYIIEGHLSHFLSVELAIVLRCDPLILNKRLSEKNWSEAKIKENVEAEILDVIKVEALEALERVHEIDTTDKTPKEVADLVEKIFSGNYKEPHVDWLTKYNHLLM
jgi:adenylate kinase